MYVNMYTLICMYKYVCMLYVGMPLWLLVFTFVLE